MIILETSGFFLTVLLVGANRNSNGFSIVRVGESGKIASKQCRTRIFRIRH